MQEVIKYFGNGRRMAESLGVTPAMVSRWRSRGWISANQAIAIERISGGRFKAVDLWRQ